MKELIMKQQFMKINLRNINVTIALKHIQIEMFYPITREPLIETYPCDTCDSHFTFQDALVKHKKRKHKEGPLTVENKCEDCGQHFNQRSHLFRHMKEQHANYSLSLCCEQCGIHFTRYENMRRHIRTSHTKALKTKVQSSKCNLTFSRKENLLRHMKLKHK